MSSYAIRPTFPIDVRSTPTIKATRDGAGFRFDVNPGAALVGETASPVFDADYQALAADTLVSFRALAAPRTLWLPKVIEYPIGQVLFVTDESGQCSVDRAITIAIFPGSGDTIAGQAAIQITDAYQGIGFRRGAANVWILAR